MTLTDWLAIVGAVAGCGSLAWQVWRDVRDRGRIKIWAWCGASTSAEGTVPLAEVRAANVGRRSLRPQLVLLVRKDASNRPLFFQQDHEPPKILEPEEDWLIATLSGEDVEQLLSIAVFDTTGRQHRMSRFAAWRVRRNAAKAARQDAERQRRFHAKVQGRA